MGMPSGRARRCREARRQPKSRSRALEKHVARRITCIGLLSLLVSVCCSGCGIGRPPVMTLEQWEVQYTRSGPVVNNESGQLALWRGVEA
jgi:hypothetical protein